MSRVMMVEHLLRRTQTRWLWVIRFCLEIGGLGTG